MARSHFDGVDAVTDFYIGGADRTNVITGIASGYKVARGSQIATANKAVNTSLTTIVAFSVAVRGSTGTQINNAKVVSARPSNATLTIYRWKATSAATTTLIAATTAGTVDWLAVGT